MAKINLLVTLSTGTRHAITNYAVDNIAPDGRRRTACGRNVQGTLHVRDADVVDCGECRKRPLHLPLYSAEED